MFGLEQKVKHIFQEENSLNLFSDSWSPILAKKVFNWFATQPNQLNNSQTPFYLATDQLSQAERPA